jgi:integrase
MKIARDIFTSRESAGLTYLRLHDLRHQFASFLVNDGRRLYEVQQILGHSDPKVTMRYAHLSTKALREAANSAAVKIRVDWFNNRRLLEPIGNIPPAEFEMAYYRQLEASADAA